VKEYIALLNKRDFKKLKEVLSPTIGIGCYHCDSYAWVPLHEFQANLATTIGNIQFKGFKLMEKTPNQLLFEIETTNEPASGEAYMYVEVTESRKMHAITGVKGSYPIKKIHESCGYSA